MDVRQSAAQIVLRGLIKLAGDLEPSVLPTDPFEQFARYPLAGKDRVVDPFANFPGKQKPVVTAGQFHQELKRLLAQDSSKPSKG